MSDIVEHLKECAKYADEYPSDKDAFNGAAKEILRLREENVRLREALEGLQEIVARKYEIGTEVEVGDDE